jgi:hypothetical protein
LRIESGSVFLSSLSVTVNERSQSGGKQKLVAKAAAQKGMGEQHYLNFARENLNMFQEICTEFNKIFVSQKFVGNQFGV